MRWISRAICRHTVTITTTPKRVGANGRKSSRGLVNHDIKLHSTKKRRNGTNKGTFKRNGTKKRRNTANFGDEIFFLVGLVNSTLTALYRVPITTDTLPYGY